MRIGLARADRRRLRNALQFEFGFDLVGLNVFAQRPRDFAAGLLAAFLRVVRALARQHQRRADEVTRRDRFAGFDLPVKFAQHRFDRRGRVLKALEDRAVVHRRFRVGADLRRLQRPDVRPMKIAVHQPAEAQRFAVEQVFLPKIFHAFDDATALHVADHDLLGAFEFGFGAQWNQRMLDFFIQRVQQRELALRAIDQGSAIRTADAFGGVRRAQRQRAAAVRAAQMRDRDALLGTRLRAAGVERQIFERHFVARVHDRFSVAVIQRREHAFRTAQIGVDQFRIGHQSERNFAVGADVMRRPFFSDDQRCHELRNRFADGQAVVIGQVLQLLFEGHVEAALRLGQPAPAVVVERRVPFVPHAAERMTHLRAPGQAERFSLIPAGETDGQRRVGVDQRRDFAQIFQIAIQARDRGAAMRADNKHRRTDLELDGSAASGAIGRRHRAVSTAKKRLGVTDAA